MARSAEQDKIFNQERVIGRKAAKMVTDYVRAVMRQKLVIDGNTDLLKKTRAKYKMGDYRLQGLDLTSLKEGFILHYGFIGTREATAVYLRSSRYNKNRTQRKAHQFNLKERMLFDGIYDKSGAIDYLVRELSETRTEAIQIKLNGLILKFNQELNNE